MTKLQALIQSLILKQIRVQAIKRTKLGAYSQHRPVVSHAQMKLASLK